MQPTSTFLNGKGVETSHQILIPNGSILVDVHAFGSLRKDLINNIGQDRANGFLFRYGFDLGMRDAKECKENEPYLTLNELIEYGPKIHSMKGFVYSRTTKLVIRKEKNTLNFLMESIWENSYEASEHYKQIGRSTSPVCFTLAGYASGFVSEATGERVIFKEVCCCAAGGSNCRAIGKTAAQWGGAIKDESYYLQATPILEELEVTYEKLLQERDNRATASEIHKRLTEEVMRGKGIDSIIQEIFKLTKIPIVIFTSHGQLLGYSGLSSLSLDTSKNELKQFFKEKINSNSFSHPHHPEIHQYKSCLLLTSTFSIQEKPAGVCVFIFNKLEDYQPHFSNMLIEKVSSVISLCLFFEKTKIDSFERMKGFFFDGIIGGHFASNEEIIAKASLIQLDLTMPYRVGVIDYSIPHTDFMNPLEIHKELMDCISDYCTKQKRDFLISQRAKQLILLLTDKRKKKKEKNLFFADLYQFLRTKYPNGDFYLGLSKRSESIKEASNAYQEAITASKMVSKSNPIIGFESLGLIGILVNENNMEEVRKWAINMLGNLKGSNPRSIELIKTLFAFLLTGGSLERTANDLSLSVGGLRYRISKIEELLQKDIRDPIISNQLLLSIQALNIIGDLDLKSQAL
ncbi:XylR N-terminal domain-containing protein [Neobacillus drentensis]|uniref:XylR N-terminal domain-containing protein n=1 Tax=Neobacillus drentensis TaxID=220684 RepID=UPI00286432DD|nr:XylR N-terminal domain-containing protein [Neobacillus drentensis]MDR7240050.1 putative hydrocarbon binding protein [Neobacillus drentensis]